jgi:hypothetical protein
VIATVNHAPTRRDGRGDRYAWVLGGVDCGLRTVEQAAVSMILRRVTCRVPMLAPCTIDPTRDDEPNLD